MPGIVKTPEFITRGLDGRFVEARLRPTWSDRPAYVNDAFDDQQSKLFSCVFCGTFAATLARMISQLSNDWLSSPLIVELAMPRLRFPLPAFAAALLAIVPLTNMRGEETQPPAPVTAEQVQASPDDDGLLNKYLGEQFNGIGSIMNSKPAEAAAKLAELEKVLAKVEPTADKAKEQVARANRTCAAYRSAIELAQTSLADLEKSLTEKPNGGTLSKWSRKVQQEISSIARSEPDEAARKLAAAKAFAEKLSAASEDEAFKTMVISLDRYWTTLDKSIEAGRKLAQLIGQPAASLAVSAWVNGAPLTDADLKGKVVLLDFWAVWCGPCIATFPHLREWNEKYADKGLVIVGLTRYYNYAWDAETNKAKRAATGTMVSHEDEQAMLVKFAEEHNLKHRFAIQVGSEMSDYYAVSGIPHVVVIDQEGKVRLMRIGSGEKNASDIGQLLAELLE
jgi:thiol-disulfide isomerase/thioredoxin